MPYDKFVFVLLLPLSFCQIIPLLHGIDEVLDFAIDHYEEINFDGLLGFVTAEAQILQILRTSVSDLITGKLEDLLQKLREIRRKIVPNLPQQPRKMLILQKYLLRPESWISSENFTFNLLENLGIYTNWSAQDILENKKAWYKGIPSDVCLMEILDDDCYVGSFCQEMMLAPRIDTGYLLSHRLFYLQIVRLKACLYNAEKFRTLTNTFCSLMLKEFRTSDHLGFPARDIALEQMVLCGIEGYSEFFNQKWRNEVLSWQTPFGCYESEELKTKRSSNIIAGGCSDHTTGLGAAALSLNLRFLLEAEDLLY